MIPLNELFVIGWAFAKVKSTDKDNARRWHPFHIAQDG